VAAAVIVGGVLLGTPRATPAEVPAPMAVAAPGAVGRANGTAGRWSWTGAPFARPGVRRAPRGSDVP
jgi:hypothetical protein